jgi:hypothetical protein
LNFSGALSFSAAYKLPKLCEISEEAQRDFALQTRSESQLVFHAMTYWAAAVLPNTGQSLPRRTRGLDAALTVARDQPNTNGKSHTIRAIGNAMAAGWPGSDRAFASLDAALTIARDEPGDTFGPIQWLPSAMATGWPGDDRAFASLDAALTVARDKPNTNWRTIGSISKAMAAGWPGSDRALASLDAALTIARNQPRENSIAIEAIAEAMANGWPGDDRAFASLDAALTIARDDVNSEETRQLVKAIATGWPGDKRAFASLDAALTVTRDLPVENEYAIWASAAAVTAGWPGNDRVFACMDAELTKARNRPKENWFLIRVIAEAMVTGRPGNDRALASLDAALTIARDLPEENFHTIGGLAGTMARGWPEDERAFTSVDVALRIAREQPKKNSDSICALAGAMVIGWPGNDQAFAALHAALTIARDHPMGDSSTIRVLANAMATGWPGRPNAAQCIATAGEVEQLDDIAQWYPWVTLFANEAAIKDWCGERGEKWGLEGDPEFAIVPIPALIGENGKPKAILIAPRERIRRGLDPALLSHIWQEREPAAFVQPGSPAKRSPKRTGKSRFPNGRIGTSEVRELVRQIATTLGYDASTLAIIMAWTRSKNGTDMMNGAVEVANAVSPDEQAIVPEADPKTGRLSIESADFITRLGGKAAKKLLAARAAEWANRREVDPWNVSEEDMKNMGSVCPGCGRIDELVRRNKRGESPVQSPCQSCKRKFADEAMCEWPKMYKTCTTPDCVAAKTLVKFAYPAPKDGWENAMRKEECCPICRVRLSRAKSFNRPKL